jgi:hypothetical protein
MMLTRQQVETFDHVFGNSLESLSLMRERYIHRFIETLPKEWESLSISADHLLDMLQEARKLYALMQSIIGKEF